MRDSVLVDRNRGFSPTRILRRLLPTLDAQGLGSLGVFLLLAVLVLGPILTVVWMTFHTGLPGQSTPLTLQNVVSVWGSATSRTIIANSLVFGLLTILVTFLFVGPLTFLLARTDLPWKGVIITLLSTVILVPTFLGAIGWILLLSPRIGIVNQILMNLLGLKEAPLTIYSMYGMAIVQGLSFVPGAYFMLSAAYAAMDPALEEAAYTSGIGKLRTFLRINLPVTSPAVIAVGVYFFMLAISVFEAPAIIGIPGNIFVMSSAIFQRMNPNVGLPDYGAAGTYGMSMLALGLLLSYLYFRTIRHSRRYVVVTGKGYRPKTIKLGRWKPLALAFVIFFLLLQPGLPLAMLIWTSLTPHMMAPSLEALKQVTLHNYDIMFAAKGTRMITNTIILIVAAPLAAIVLSIAVSWVVTRTRSRLRGWVDVLAFMPHAIPSILFAVALNYLALFNRDRISLYGTVTIIIMAHAIAYLAYGSRTLNSVLIQIHRELEEAGRLAGLTALGAMRKILAPLIATAVFNTWFWILLLSYREVTMALILFNQKNDVIATGVWLLWQDGRTNEVAALGTILLVVAVSLTVLVSFLFRRTMASRSGSIQSAVGAR